jgi:hypothetical protein
MVSISSEPPLLRLVADPCPAALSERPALPDVHMPETSGRNGAGRSTCKVDAGTTQRPVPAPQMARLRRADPPRTARRIRGWAISNDWRQ